MLDIAHRHFLSMLSMTGIEGLRNFEQHTDLKQDHGLPRYFLALLNGVIKLSKDYIPLNRNVFFLALFS